MLAKKKSDSAGTQRMNQKTHIRAVQRTAILVKKLEWDENQAKPQNKKLKKMVAVAVNSKIKTDGDSNLEARMMIDAIVAAVKPDQNPPKVTPTCKGIKTPFAKKQKANRPSCDSSQHFDLSKQMGQQNMLPNACVSSVIVLSVNISDNYKRILHLKLNLHVDMFVAGQHAHIIEHTDTIVPVKDIFLVLNLRIYPLFIVFSFMNILT